jgi:hypothetical protein
MAFWIPAAMIASSLISGLLANKKQTSTQTSAPTIDPAYGGLQQMLIDSITKRMSSGSSLPAGYETKGIQDINRAYGNAGTSLSNTLTARGLSTSPVAGNAATQFEMARGGDIGRFQQNLPLVQRDLENQDFSLINSILGQGRGQTSTMTQAGNQAGGAATSLSSMLAYLYGKGAFNGGTAAQPGAYQVPGGTSPYLTF